MNTPVTKSAPAAQVMGRSVLMDMADRFGMEPKRFEEVVMKTLMPKGQNAPAMEEVAAFLLVAKEYNLNPFTREIFAFPSKGGGISPIVSIDGWLKLLNSNPDYNGADFKDHFSEDGRLTAISCRIHHKRRQHPIEVTEYLSECKRNTDPWRTWPARMLRHKTLIQCARYAFGYAGILEPDEAERLPEVSLAPVGAGVAGLKHALNAPEPELECGNEASTQQHESERGQQAHVEDPGAGAEVAHGAPASEQRSEPSTTTGTGKPPKRSGAFKAPE